MDKINTMKEFKQTLESLTLDQQRVVAARFVAEVLDLSDDERIIHAQKVAADPDSTPDAIMSAYHSAWHAAIESSVHSEDWDKQTAHFVAKACAESLAPAHPGVTACHLATNVASHCRMARLCASIEHEREQPSLAKAEKALGKLIQSQFKILGKFLREKRK